MAFRINSYFMDVYTPAKKFKISHVFEIIKQWREIKGQKQNKITIKPNVLCKYCGTDNLKLINKSFLKCTFCNNQIHIRIVRSVTGAKKKSKKLKILHYIEFPIKRRQIYPKAISIDTGNVVIAEKYMKQKYTNEKLQYISIPYPIFWKSRAVLCLVKLLTLIDNINHIHSIVQLENFVNEKYKTQFSR